MFIRSTKCTNWPSLNKATDGDDGVYGNMYSLALATASTSCPANTVYKLSGFLSLANERIIPGRAAPAAQPHTELTTTKLIPLLLDIVFSTSSEVFNSVKPTFVNSARIGDTNISGYGIL